MKRRPFNHSKPPAAQAHQLPDHALPPPSPLAYYLSRLSSGASRDTVLSRLNRIAAAISGNVHDAASMPWHTLRYQHLAALRDTLVRRNLAPATCNNSLTAVKGILRAAHLLGLIPTTDYDLITTVPRVTDDGPLPGRLVSTSELHALFEACRDHTAIGRRDAAMIAALFAAGLRRAEVVALPLDSYDPDSGSLRILGKGRKRRAIDLSPSAARAIDVWLRSRSLTPGPLICRIYRKGHVHPDVPISPEAVKHRLHLRARQAYLKHFTPHDLRRSFITQLLDSGHDLGIVRNLAGHANIETTTRYDRRGSEAMSRASQGLHVPYEE